MNIFKPGREPLITLSGPARELLQAYYQERYGDELTKAIKVARKNSRRRAAGKA